MSENGPVLPPEVYRRRRIVAVIALLAVILLLVAGVTSMVGMINGKKDATVASTATASGAPFQSFSARPSETASATPSASATASATATASASASVTPSVTASAAPTASVTTATPVATPTTPAPTPSVTTAAVVAACTANDLKVTVTPAKRTFAAGEQVSFHVTYTNSWLMHPPWCIARSRRCMRSPPPPSSCSAATRGFWRTLWHAKSRRAMQCSSRSSTRRRKAPDGF